MNNKNEVWVNVKEGSNLLGISLQAIKKNCKAKKYTTKMVSGNGGQQYRILLSSLPQSAQDKYFAEKTAVVLAENTPAIGEKTQQTMADEVADRHRLREQGLRRYNSLPASKKAPAKAKELLIRAYLQYVRESNLGRVAGLYDFCEQLNAGQLSLHNRVLEAVPIKFGVHHLTPATFKNWVYDYEKYGLIALVNNYGSRANQSVIERNEELKQYVLGFILKYPHAKGKKIKSGLEAEKPQINIVSDKSINRYIKEWKKQNAQIWTYITHPDKWKNIYMSAMGSHFEAVTTLNGLWEMDSTPGDWLLKDGRHSVIGCIDMYSRRLTYYVSKTSSADAVCRCFRKAVIAWGLPERVRTDNGKDYVSNRFMDTLSALETPQDLCVPFASEEKGTVERQFRTMLHGVLELLPGFIGHNVAQAQQIRSMSSFSERIMTKGEVVEVEMTAAELQAILDRWANVMYAQDVHSGLKGKTPAQMAALYSGTVKRIDNIRSLDMLLSEPAGTRTVNKSGIRFNNYDYIGQELADHIGKQVHLYYDERDIGNLIVYCESEFICIAQAAELSNISRQEVAAATKKAQKRKQNEQAKELKSFRKEVSNNIPEVVMRHREEQAENVVMFPRPADDYSTSALEQAAIAERTLNGLADEQPAPVDVKPALPVKAKVIELLKIVPEVNILAMNDQQKYRYWQGLDGQIKEGDGLSDKEMNFYERFPKTDTYRLIRDVQQDLAEQAKK